MDLFERFFRAGLILNQHCTNAIKYDGEVVPCGMVEAADRQLVESGVVTIAGPTSGDRFNELTTVYNGAMAESSGPDCKIASITPSVRFVWLQVRADL